MERQFVYENIAFDYQLFLEKRKTVSLTVFPNQSVVVKAPKRAARSKIEDFLRRKSRWVLKQQRYFATFKPRAKKEYVSGETFRYLGRSYKLLVRKTEEDEHVSLRYGTLIAFSRCPENALKTKKLIHDWYSEKARKHFSERLKACIREYGIVNPPGLVIRLMKSRWGSYSRRTDRICLNLRLIQASKDQIDYVITHELCHIKHAGHDRRFYSLLSRRLPGWKQAKTALELSLNHCSL